MTIRIRGAFNTGDVWEDHAESIDELASVIQSIRSNETVSEYKIYDGDEEKSLEDVIDDHMDEIDAEMQASDDPDAYADQIIESFNYNPWA